MALKLKCYLAAQRRVTARTQRHCSDEFLGNGVRRGGTGGQAHDELLEVALAVLHIHRRGPCSSSHARRSQLAAPALQLTTVSGH